MRYIAPWVIVVFVAGCQSDPVAPPPRVETAPAAPMAVAPVPAPEPMPAEPSKEARAAADLLLRGGELDQLVSRQSAFSQAAEFVRTGWSGLVLSPKNVKQGIVCTSDFQIERVEIHPLMDGRLRVWVELRNLKGKAANAEAACEFRPTTTRGFIKFAPLSVIAPRGRTLLYFESPRTNVEGYSVMVRDQR